MMALWTDFELPVKEDDILRGQGADPITVRARRPALVETAARALAEGMPHLHPSAQVREAPVRESLHGRLILDGGKQLSGSLIGQRLAGARSIIAALCTIGSELEELSAQVFDVDPLFALALDGLGNAAVEALAGQACNRIAAQAAEKGLGASTPLSPGDQDWPVEAGQAQIFELLDPSRSGVRLSSGGMMIPRKSMTFIVGLGIDMFQVDLCEICRIKRTCRYRRT
jgi:hypothetical protein